MGTRKSSRAAHCLFFAHASLRFMRRGMGRGSRRWSTRSVRPLWALAKTPCADGAARSFFLCLRSCKHGAGIRKTPALLRSEAFLLVGAGGRTRTDTDFTPQDFESSASASFTTPAQITIYHSTGELTSVLRSSARERSLCTFHGIKRGFHGGRKTAFGRDCSLVRAHSVLTTRVREGKMGI